MSQAQHLPFISGLNPGGGVSCRADQERERAIKQARQEASALAAQYQTIIGGLRAADESFYSAEIDRLERLARIIGGLDRT